MFNFSCSCKSDCTGLGIFAALIAGIVTAILRFNAIITLTPAFLWTTLGIAVVYLAILLFKSAFRSSDSCCRCKSLKALLFGILGTIITSLVLLGVTFAATSILGALITGALLTFLVLIFTSAACLVLCVSECSIEQN